MHKPIFDHSIALDSGFLESSSPLPLTKENLMALDKNDALSNEILQRYCHEINSNNTLLQQQHLTALKPSNRERCQSTPPHIQRNDLVVASPKLLPFPYHNDSLFLPTAEKIQYHYHHLRSSGTTSITSTSRTDASSIVPESEVLISRPHSTACIPNSPSVQSLASVNPSRPLMERRSLPIKLDYSNIVISGGGAKSQRFLRRSSFSSISTTSSVGCNTGNEKKPWLKRIFKFFNKNKYKKQQQSQSIPNSNDLEAGSQVWYCRYSKNPSTDLEKYYYHHQYQHQRPMVSVT